MHCISAACFSPTRAILQWREPHREACIMLKSSACLLSLFSIALLHIHAVTQSLLRAAQKNLSFLLNSEAFRINFRNFSGIAQSASHSLSSPTFSWATGPLKLARGNPLTDTLITGAAVFLMTCSNLLLCNHPLHFPECLWKTTRA